VGKTAGLGGGGLLLREGPKKNREGGNLIEDRTGGVSSSRGGLAQSHPSWGIIFFLKGGTLLNFLAHFHRNLFSGKRLAVLVKPVTWALLLPRSLGQFSLLGKGNDFAGRGGERDLPPLNERTSL